MQRIVGRRQSLGDISSRTAGTVIIVPNFYSPRRLWRSWLMIMVIGTLAVGASFIPRPEPDKVSVFHSALVACNQARMTEANRLADELATKPEANHFALVIRGAIRLRSGRCTDALRYFTYVRPEGEIRESVLKLTGECLYRLGQLHNAARVMTELAREHPEDPAAHRWLGAIYYDLGLRSQAIEELETASRLAPTDAGPPRLLGSIYYDYRQYTDARRHLQRAFDLAGLEDYETIAELGHSLIELHEYQRAIAVLAPVANRPDIMALRAEALWSVGRSSEAAREVESVLRAAPENLRANLLQARMDALEGRLASAIQILSSVAEREPHDVSVRYELAKVLRENGREAEAKGQLELMQQSREVHERYVDLANQAALQPYDAEVRRELGRICRAIGKMRAASAWERAAAACSSADNTSEDGSFGPHHEFRF
jgi:Flp pilus assembly protein TadD